MTGQPAPPPDAGQGTEIEVYRQMIEGVLGVAFPPGWGPITRYMRFVLEHRRMPTEDETFSQINCPALAEAQDASAGSTGGDDAR